MSFLFFLAMRLSLALAFSYPGKISRPSRRIPLPQVHRSFAIKLREVSDDSSSSSATRNFSSTENDNTFGIGGLGGAVFDVNKLKRNLLQETVQLYKEDMLALLSHPETTEQDVARKLGALVQGSAVRTTTDSNLLDNDVGALAKSYATNGAHRGRINLSQRTKSTNTLGRKRVINGVNDAARLKWTLAYTSKYTHLDDLLRPLPSEIRKRSRRRKGSIPALRQQEQSRPSSEQSPAARRRSGKQSLVSTRFLEFHLEGLHLEEPMTVDTRQYLGGLFSIQHNFRVCGLTRTNLLLQRESDVWYVLGRRIAERRIDPKNPPRRVNMQLVYLDVDMAVLAETIVDTSLSATARAVSDQSRMGTSSPAYSVYTKNPAWADALQRRRRKLQRLVYAARRGVKTILLKRQIELDRAIMSWKSPEDEVNQILQELQLDTSSKLKVLKLGNWTLTEDEAWDGLSDPFVHLSADERQEILKRMKIRDVEQAASVQRSKQRQAQSPWLWKLIRRQPSFKKPRR